MSELILLGLLLLLMPVFIFSFLISILRLPSQQHTVSTTAL